MFRFSLQTVLDVRERFERIKYKEYSQELLVKQRLDSGRGARVQAIRRAGENADQLRTTTHTALPLQLHDQFRRRLLDEIQVLDGQLRDQDELVDVKRKELVEARRSHRALEILREKEYKRYLSEEAKRERTVMDEVATNYHIFRQ